MPDSVDFSRKPVLILGASGFIGSRVAAALAASAVYKPIPASRRPGAGASALRFDATNPAAMRAALTDVDAVVNCIAADARTMVRATEVLCQVARAVPPRRIVHLSSMAIYGAATGTIGENHPTVLPISRHGQAKAACERIVQKFVSDGGDAVILRPTCVFGPGSAQWTTRLAALLRDRRIGDLGVAGDGICNLAYIDDVVAAVVSSLSACGVSGKIFNVSSSADLTWNQFLVAFAKALRATPVRRVSPLRLAIETKLLAPVRGVAALAFGSGVTDAITPSWAALWRQDIEIDCSAAASALDLPRTPPDQMITAAVRWLRPAPASRYNRSGKTAAEGEFAGSGGER